MAIYNAFIATTDDLGREWVYFTRVRAVSMWQSLGKARMLVENAMGETSHRAAVSWCDHQEDSILQMVGKNGKMYAIGRYEGEVGYPYSREVNVKDGAWHSMSDLDMSTHYWVVGKVEQAL